MSEIETLVEEIGGNDPRMGTNYRDEDVYADPLTVGQAAVFRRSIDMVAPPTFSDDDAFFELWERVRDIWGASTYFGGQVSEHGYIDSVYVVYDGIDGTCETSVGSVSFEEWATIRFKSNMSFEPAENAGLCAVCDDRIEIGDFSRYGEDALYRQNAGDDALWAAPDEFDFREYDGYGETLRMWWD